jgi:hypothetical protein
MLRRSFFQPALAFPHFSRVFPLRTSSLAVPLVSTSVRTTGSHDIVNSVPPVSVGPKTIDEAFTDCCEQLRIATSDRGELLAPIPENNEDPDAYNQARQKPFNILAHALTTEFEALHNNQSGADVAARAAAIFSAYQELDKIVALRHDPSAIVDLDDEDLYIPTAVNYFSQAERTGNLAAKHVGTLEIINKVYNKMKDTERVLSDSEKEVDNVADFIKKIAENIDVIVKWSTRYAIAFGITFFVVLFWAAHSTYRYQKAIRDELGLLNEQEEILRRAVRILEEVQTTNKPPQTDDDLQFLKKHARKVIDALEIVNAKDELGPRLARLLEEIRVANRKKDELDKKIAEQKNRRWVGYGWYALTAVAIVAATACHPIAGLIVVCALAAVLGVVYLKKLAKQKVEKLQFFPLF